MLRVKVKTHRLLLILLSVLIVLSTSGLGAYYYFSDQAIAKQQADASEYTAQMDRKNAELTKKRLAEEKARKEKEEAERKAKEEAEQKADADKALVAQQQGQVVTPKGCAISGAHGNPASIDVVVNKKRCFNPIDFVPPDLTSYNGYVVSAKIVPDMTAMFQAAAAAGVPMSLTSSYRSYSNQVTTYNNWVRVNGSTAAADTVSARPGYSEHQTGFAIDLAAGGCSLECFSGSAQYNWLVTHGATYGFIQRYPAGLESITGYSTETWHWRYVGPATAQAMKASGAKTLEQFWGVAGGGY